MKIKILISAVRVLSLVLLVSVAVLSPRSAGHHTSAA